jgi:hypothetical protein
LLGVDHGLTFHQERKLRTVIWDFAGERVPDGLLADVQVLQGLLSTEDSPRIAVLMDLINAPELMALRARIDEIVTTPVMPHPYSRHDIPYPPL